MDDFFEIVAKLTVLMFVITTMIAVGLTLQLRDLTSSLSRPRLVAFALLANFVAAPALAYGLTEMIPLKQPYAAGLLLLSCAAGAPFLPKLAELARGDVAFSVSLMLLLTLASVVFMPVTLPLLIPGLSASAWAIAKPLLLTMLLPLAAAMLLRNRQPKWANLLRPAFKLVSNIALLLAVVLLISLNLGDMAETFGSGAALTAMLFVLLGTGIGYALGGASPGTRSVLGLGTGQRNIAAALVIAADNFSDPRVTVMLLVATFSGLLVLLVAARRFARLSPISQAELPSGTVAPSPEEVRQ